MMSAGRLTALTFLTICSLLPAESVRAQEVDVAGLVHPEVAERLSLDDAQRAKIQQLLLDRAQALAAIQDDTPAGKEEQTALKEKFRQDILAVLTPEQNAQWAAPQPTQKLMFQFRDMKWEDVLNWFASQQDLTLVMDRTPGGTFTYSDTRSYSPGEGIDLLNSVLMTRGFTLVRREKMLVVMELSANIPLELLPRVPLEQLDERGRFEIVSVLFPLDGRPVDAVLQEVKPYLSSYGRAIPLARGGQLLVVETAGKMSTINELIASVPVPKQTPKPEPTPPPQPVFAAYALGELDSGAALETIRKLIPSEQITVDGRTGVLSAFVIPAQQTAIKSAIDQMQASHAELADTETVAYRFAGIKPEELQRQIAALAPRAILTVTADRALVTADAADQQVVRSALNALDIQPVAVDRTLKVFEVSKSSAEQVATALRTFLPNSFVVSNAATGNVLVRGSQQDLQFAQDVVDMWRESQTTAAAELHAIELDRPATAGWLTTVKQVVPDATLWLSESLPNVPQHLMLLGSQQDFATVERLLPQLLSALPEADRRELKIYPLTENQRARQITLATLPAELSDIKLVNGQNGQELLVWAAPEQHTAFAELLNQLDQPLTTSAIVPKSYSLNVQNTSTVTTLLTAEFPTVQLTVNTAGDELTVLASSDQHARIAERIAEFNAELPSKPELLVESYAVDGMTAVALQQALLPLLGTAQTTLDSQGERLLVRADAETHAELHQMATALGAKPAAGRQKVVLAYPLEHAAATNVKLLLDQIVRDATVLADDAMRQVVVTGSADTQAQVKAAIDQIDRAGKKHPAAELHALELDRPATTAWLTTVKQIVPEATLWLSESLPNVPQHLMLLGSQQDFAKVERLLPQLLSVLPAADRRELKIYPLTENQRARQITLATLPAELSDIKLVNGQNGQELLVWAAPEQHTAFAELLNQLDQPLTTSAIVPKSYSLNVQNTSAVTTLLTAEFPTVQLTVNTAGDELTVLASSDQHARIAERIAEFNAELPSKPELLVESYAVDGMTAVALQQALLPLLGTAQTTLDSQGERLLVRADAETHAELHQMATALGAKPAAGRQKVVLAYPLEHAAATNVKLLLDQIVRDATVLADDKLRQVVVTGSLETQAQVKAAIDQIDRTGSVRQAAEIRSYDAGQLTASALLTTLQAMWPSMQLTVDGVSNQVVASGTPEEHEQLEAAFEQLTSAPGGDAQLAKTYSVPFGEMSTLPSVLKQLAPRALISSDPVSRTVTVWATQPQQKLVEQALEALNQTARDAQQPATYLVKPTQLLAIQTSLRTLFPAAVSTSDPTTGQLVVVASQDVQSRIASVVEMLSNGAGADEATTKVFTFDPKQVELSNILVALKSTIPAQVRLESNPANHTLLAIGTAEDLERVSEQVQRLIEQMPSPDTMSSVVYPLRHANPLAAVTVLARLLPQSTLAPDVASKTISATAKAEDHKAIAEFLTGFDQPTADGRQTRVFSIGSGDAASLQVAIRDFSAEASVTADRATNSLIVTATPEQLEQIGKIVDQVEKGGSEAQLAKTYPVPFGEMSTLSSLLKQLAPRALLSPDPVSRTVTVWATPPQQELVEQALAALSQTARDAQQPATYLVKPTQLLAIQTSLRTLFPAAVSTSDPTTGQLVVVASQDVQSRIASVVEMLSNGAGADEATTKVFTFDPKQVELSNILVALKSTIPAQVRLESNPANHTLLAIGSAEDLERVSEQVQRLIEQMPSPDTMSSVVYPLRHANPQAAVTVLARLLPQSTLAPDVASKTISATAKAEDHKAITEFLTGFDQPTVNDKETHVYRLLRGNGRGLSYVLSSLMPDATFYGSPDSGGLVATALPEQHERIAAIVKEFDNDRENVKTQVFVVGKGSAASLQVAIKSFSTEAGVTADQATDSLIVTATPEELKQIGEIVDQVKKGGNDKETHVYRLQRGDGRGLSFVLQSLMPDATFYGSRETGGLIATAQPEQHKRIAAIVKEFDNERENVKTRVFVVGNGDAVSLQDAIANISSEASVTADRASNSLIVTATPEELEQIGEIVDQVEKGGSEPRSTRFYPVLGSEPIALSRALEGSFAKATFAADSAGGGLFATATEEEHAELAKVIEELNSQPTRLPTLKSFTLKHASPEAVASALEDAFGRRSLAGVSFNRETRSVFVVGSRDDLQVAQALVEQIDVLGSNSDSRKMRVFSLGGADGRSISSAIENLFPESSAPVDVRYDPLNEQLFVVGDPEQIKLVEEMLEQLTPPERQLEIVQLEATDPYSFKLAADALFEDEPVNSAPSISIDSDQQRVIIRATDTQLVSLRKLLQQMGETPSGSRIGSSARLRFIPVHRNSEKLLDEIRRLWPAAGDNVLEVIRPAGNPNDTKNEKDKDTRSEKNDGTDALEEEMPTAKLTSAPQANPVDTNTADEAASSGDKISDESSTAVPSEAADDSAGLKATDNQANRPAIVVVVGDEQWTVASADTQALDQFQRLLDTLLSPRIEPYSTTGNYSVYLLRHAGADQVQELLSDLFRPERGRSSSVSDLMQRVKIVADSRINALIVSGNRQDRRTVEELLGVLDSEDLLDSLQQITPTTLALESASANNVEAILRDVYRSQLSSGAGRRPVPIPEGVSSDVASLLQQLNAQSSGPLLTLAVDETSNSIIFRAPIELTAEIREFVESLDRKSQQTPSKRVDLIRLQSTNTKSLQQALKILLAK